MFHKPIEFSGVGINYRSEIANDILNNLGKIDFLEINTERFLTDRCHPLLQTLVHAIPVVLHGLSFSVGATQPTHSDYIKFISRCHEQVPCLWWSEHIGATHVQGLQVRALMPPAFNDENVELITSKIKEMMRVTPKPLLMENIAYYYRLPHSYLKEADFISRIINNADCGLLLDLNNLYVNAKNHHYDPYEFLNQIPLERVVEVHIAGCQEMHGMLVDTHAASPSQDVLNLFDYVCKHAFINGALIEWDGRIEKFEQLLPDIGVIKDIFFKNGYFKK
jgi:uncharacterized protein (UPF0276 family)